MKNMKNRINSLKIFSLSFLLITLSSCLKDDRWCKYDNRRYVDSSLYVSFKLNDTYKKYYQIIPTWKSSPDMVSLIYSEDELLIYKSSYIESFIEEFDESLILKGDTNGDFRMTFSKRNKEGTINTFYTEVTPEELYPNTLYPSYTIERGFDNTYPEDTIFMNGYSLDIITGSSLKYLSTDNVFKHYSQNKDSIDSYFRNTNFNITKLEKKCANYYIIEGSFNTKFLSEGVNPESYYLTEGKFRIIRKFE